LTSCQKNKKLSQKFKRKGANDAKDANALYVFFCVPCAGSAFSVKSFLILASPGYEKPSLVSNGDLGKVKGRGVVEFLGGGRLMAKEQNWQNGSITIQSHAATENETAPDRSGLGLSIIQFLVGA